MDTLSYLGQGFGVALSPYNLVTALIGTLIGTVVGLLPGLGPINGVALLIPVAFALGLPPESALILLAAVYLGCEYGGRISSILLNIPGEASTVMTTLDGYPMARNGLAGVALSLSAWSSFIGAFIATCGMVLFAPLLAKWAIAFGPAEYFVLMVFAIVALGGLAGDRPLKTLLAALLGLFLSSVGIDANSGVYRFTFESIHVADGIQFVVLVLGLFSVSEILLLLEKTHHGHKAVEASGRMLFNLKEAASVFVVNLRCGLLGFIMGVLPGAGATLASAVAYMTEKRYAGTSGKFGQGDMRGLAAPETAIGASACGALVPMLTLGVPGSGTTAVMIGALSLYNITPGPLLFQEQPTIVWGLIASLFIANLMLIILNVPMVRVFTRILSVPNWALVPGIAIITAIGVYAVHATTFDLFLMVGIGILGYILRKLDFPLSPLLLGFILGGLMEQNLRRALSISNGELGILWSSPIAIGTWTLVAAMLVLPLYRAWRRRLARRNAELAGA
ncbi:putative tricarboxylic transport membrane protein [Pseudomonas citronellolis]|uniref:tripartite tricarboxylate transporter permease n=1 Tax=Pseudomonas citronellolis TaxID=53408 RepID=UPI0020A16527|nr:tripartite tricarboxylate transporter permease [Pseudomonas citronellolis]MCP1641748.1 putative tricarboxylic transport membrane protein [Pseudomonas citronellolis]MCP1664666.1 putative tricarboxylic transport membrane protein [Pseudomonas citronellolis]MCP1695875.1 putative tricarboxylic transport membrane protein [Pseudomonas citronellolis]MCP1702502.1 putative tricarboxylic transport membrane protein [Pseudomonas citronellolis]MCP1796387.1 putative tricarboxylic transport membrane protei